jgi:5-methylcytosine-specific restriction endonuclease McrBC regulatory subunit McrC
MPSLSEPRTLVLIERQPRIVRLRAVDVAFLLEHHRGQLELLPTGQRDHYRLTALGCAGVLVAPRCRFIIQPKIPLANVFALLDPLAPTPTATAAVRTRKGTELLECLVGLLARQMAERVANGLPRVYREQCEQGPLLHGQLDMPAQLRQAPGRKDQLHSRYEELSADGACHRIIKATAEGLLPSPLLGEEVRAALRTALAGFEGVASLPLSPRLWDEAALENIPEAFRPLLDLCHLLADSLIPANSAGNTAAPSFLIDLERIFETYVTRGIVAAFADSEKYTVAVQVTHTVNRPVAGQADLTIRPDATMDRDGRTVLVVDAKWKRWPRSAEPGDLYQMLAYGATLDADGMALVYPGKRWRVREYRFAHTPLRLTMYALPVGGTRAACVRSVHRLARALHVSANTLP